MSGLAAIFHRDGRPAEAGPVWDMLAAAPHRGPDGMDCRVFGPLALGHARLAITPEDTREQQPLVSLRTGCAIVADVRLDNRDELLRDLPASDRQMGDAALILCAYETWGLDAVRRLIGDFAFLIWDPRVRRLIAARDVSAQRTLFYRMDRDVFAAASEIHQLLQDPGVPCEADEESIQQMLVPAVAYKNAKDRPSTFYRGILSVPAGHLICVDAETHATECYWRIDPGKELRYRRDDEYAEHYRELLFRVVRDRMRSNYATGALLSGGLDSTSVVGAVQELLRGGDIAENGFTSFSVTYGELACDERPLIEDLRDKYGFKARFIQHSEASPSLELAPWGFSEAPLAPGPAMGHPLWEAMKASGVRTALTGDVADACVYGSRMVLDSLLRQAKLARFWRHLAAFRRGSRESLGTILLFGCVMPLLPLPLHRQYMAFHIHQALRACQHRLLPTWMPESLRESLSERHVELCVRAERERRFSNPAREEEYRFLYPPFRDRDPVGEPIQIWRPFADRRLHEFLFAIPPEQKFEPHPQTDDFYAGSKWLVRRAMRGILPDSIRLRTNKTFFTSAARNEIQRDWAAYEAVFGPGGQSELAARGYIEPRKFWDKLVSLRAGEPAADLIYVMTVVGLEVWLRRFRQPRAQLLSASALPMEGVEHRAGRRAGALV